MLIQKKQLNTIRMKSEPEKLITKLNEILHLLIYIICISLKKSNKKVHKNGLF